ncbi:MAG: amidohydrolase, partial [Planctomycetaceae bacterium]|nr:amidohydrolase [Planctomycetaceae bacterium]
MIGFSRRQFLGTAIASSAPLWSSSVFAQPEPTIDPIDAHVHVWTPDVTRFPLAENDVSVMQPASFTPQQLFAQCKPAGVKRIVLIQ